MRAATTLPDTGWRFWGDLTFEGTLIRLGQRMFGGPSFDFKQGSVYVNENPRRALGRTPGIFLWASPVPAVSALLRGKGAILAIVTALNEVHPDPIHETLPDLYPAFYSSRVRILKAWAPAPLIERWAFPSVSLEELTPEDTSPYLSDGELWMIE